MYIILKHFFYIPNLLSLLRIFLIVPFIYTISLYYYYIAFVLVLIAMLTDFLDGLLARKLNQVSDLGKIIDPLADKICIIAVFVYFAIIGKIPLWFMILVIVRDVAVFFGGIYINKKKGVVVQSNYWGKWTSAVISVYFLACIIDSIYPIAIHVLILMCLSLLMLLISTTTYVIKFVTLLKKSN